MDRFYPKNFAMWRLQLLLLLIFLEAIYDSTGLLKGVQASTSDAWHKSSCSDDSECLPQHECDLSRKECVCRNNYNSKKIRSFYAALYDRKRNMCVSLVGKICSLDDDSGLDKFACIPNAVCARQPGLRLSSIFGLCQCAPGFEETEKHICAPAPMIVFPTNDRISSMAQVGGGNGNVIPSEGGMDHSSNDDSARNQGRDSASQGSASNNVGKPPTSETEDENANLDLEGYDNIIKSYVTTRIPVNGGNLGHTPVSRYLLIVSMAMTLMLFFR